MPFSVVVTDDAATDLTDIHAYIAQHDSVDAADRVVDRIGRVLRSLESLPERGPYVPELLELGLRTHRELLFKPYRVIYGVADGQVVVYLNAMVVATCGPCC